MYHQVYHYNMCILHSHFVLCVTVPLRRHSSIDCVNARTCYSLWGTNLIIICWYNVELSLQAVSRRPACHRDGPGSIPCQSEFDVWWRKWQCDRFLYQYWGVSFSCEYHSTNAVRWFSSTCRCYQQDKEDNSGLTYLLYLLAYLHTLLACLLTCLLTLFACVLTYLLTYSTCLPSCLLTYLLTYLLT